MGRGLEDFSHLFVSQDAKAKSSLARREVCLFSPFGEIEKPFLVTNLALALTQKGRRVGILEADLQFPPVSHLLDPFHAQLKPLRVLLPPTSSLLQGIAEMGRQSEIVLIDAPPFSSPLSQIILKLVGEAIVILPVDLLGRIGSYQLIKSIHLFREEVRIGVVIAKVCTAQEAKANFEGMKAVAGRHLKIDLRDYGFLLNDLHISQSIKEGRSPLSSIVPSRLKRAILNIADLILEGEVDNNFCEKFELALREEELGYQG